MANLKDLLVNGSTNHIGRNYSQTPALGTKDRQVATTEFVLDNCYKPPLLSFMWADHLLNDMSWLRADTFSWQDGTTYSLIYNELLSEYNNSASVEETEGSITFKRTPNGYKIALADQENAILNKYNSNGIAWYYILDTTNKKFKLPRTKFGFEGLRTSVGDDIEAGLPNIIGVTGTAAFAPLEGAIYSISGGGTGDTYHADFDHIGFDASRSNPIYGKSDTVQPPATQMYLYFYVGEFARNSVQQTAGLNSELFNGKVDLNFNNMNPSQTAKNIIAGWGMPDYSAGVDYANDTTVHTAPSNGILEISYTVAAATIGYLKINGIDAAASYHTSGYLTMLTGQYMLSEGDTFQITSPAYVVSGSLLFIYRFYPCKGAN